MIGDRYGAEADFIDNFDFLNNCVSDYNSFGSAIPLRRFLENTALQIGKYCQNIIEIIFLEPRPFGLDYRYQLYCDYRHSPTCLYKVLGL